MIRFWTRIGVELSSMVIPPPAATASFGSFGMPSSAPKTPVARLCEISLFISKGLPAKVRDIPPPSQLVHELYEILLEIICAAPVPEIEIPPPLPPSQLPKSFWNWALFEMTLLVITGDPVAISIPAPLLHAALPAMM